MKIISRNADLQLKKIVTMMRMVYLLQSIIVIAVAVISCVLFFVKGEVPTTQTVMALLIVIAVMVVFNGYFMFRDTNVFKRLNNQIEIKDESYRNIEALNLELRSQRHDFLNHLQILYSLMEMEAYEDTTTYLNRLYGDVGKLSANIKTNSVAMNALLQAKSNEAETRNIPFEIRINSRLEFLNMPDWELCRVIGNMIDNGLTAAELFGPEGCLSIDIKENIKDYEMVISNSSQPIEDVAIQHFFTPGFTTKRVGDNHGMGLHISDVLMKKYNNHIHMSYKDELIIVKLVIHKSLTSSADTDS